MMDRSRYVVKQAIKDTDNRVLGYEIMYSGIETQGAAEVNEESEAETIYNCLVQNSEKTLNDSRTFMTFTSSLLAKKTPHLFKNTDLVIQIDDNIVLHPFAMTLLKQYMQEGYEVAASNFQLAPRYLALLDQLSYIKINLKTLNSGSAENITKVAKSTNKLVIATGVDTEELANFAKKLDVHAMQGCYVTDKMTKKIHKKEYLQSNFYKLAVALSRDEPELCEIERIISSDASLSYGLLQIVNSDYFARRVKTESIERAIVILGLNQLKHFIYLLSVGSIADEDMQDFEEFIKLSLMRAKFASAVHHHIHNSSITKSEAYMLGMMSTLEHFIDASMCEILKEITLTDEVKNALIKGSGQGGELIKLITCYEKSDWKNISVHAQNLGINADILTKIYFNCMQNVKDIWEQIINPHFIKKMKY